jgi:hypothetical protein
MAFTLREKNDWSQTMNSSTVARDAGRHKADELAIESLAKEMHAGVDIVRQLYEAEHARLSAEARIKTYVSVFATRMVRSALQETRHAVQ